MGFALAGLALAAVTLTRQSAATGSSEPVRALAPPAAMDVPAPRVVGAVAVPPPVAPAAPSSEPPAPRTASAEPDTAPPGHDRPAVATLDVGQLPVLELDASAFEPPPVAEAPRPPGRTQARPQAPRLAVQP